MGAWGTGSFDNDDAQDFLGRLEMEGPDAIKAALEEVTKLDLQAYLDAPEASSAIAAAEIVAAACDGLVSRLPEAARDWLAEHRESVVAPPFSVLARRAVERALAQSELRDLWEECKDGQSEEWANVVRELSKRLDPETPPVAKPKSRRGPRVRKVAFEPGAVLRVDLDNEWHTYARMLARPSKIAFYDCRVASALKNLQEVVQKPVLFVLEVGHDAYDKGRWPKVGQVPLEGAPIAIPERFMQNIASGKCRIVDEVFNVRPATPEECVGLEKVAVWGPQHVEERLRDHYAGRSNADAARMRVRFAPPFGP